MTKTGRRVLSMLLWSWGGTVYFLLEVAFKTLLGKQEQISWTMLVLAVILTVAVERCGYQLPWEVPLWIQALACALLVTVVELVAGVILNIWLGLDIWDYSHLPFNLWGQVCPQFSAVWWFLCLLFIPAFDWLRWSVEGGQRPKYRLM